MGEAATLRRHVQGKPSRGALLKRTLGSPEDLGKMQILICVSAVGRDLVMLTSSLWTLMLLVGGPHSE